MNLSISDYVEICDYVDKYAADWEIDSRATGERLFSYRRKNNLTQEDLSGLFVSCRKSASRVVISKWENGSKTPSLLHLVFLARLYGCTLDELVVIRQCSREHDDRDQLVPLEKYIFFVLRRMYAFAYVRLFVCSARVITWW